MMNGRSRHILKQCYLLYKTFEKLQEETKQIKLSNQKINQLNIESWETNIKITLYW